MNSLSYLFKQLQKGKKLISSSSISRLLWVHAMLGLNQIELLSAFILEILGGEKKYYVAEADHQDTMDNAGPLKVEEKSPQKGCLPLAQFSQSSPIPHYNLLPYKRLWGTPSVTPESASSNVRCSFSSDPSSDPAFKTDTFLFIVTLSFLPFCQFLVQYANCPTLPWLQSSNISTNSREFCRALSEKLSL